MRIEINSSHFDGTTGLGCYSFPPHFKLFAFTITSLTASDFVGCLPHKSHPKVAFFLEYNGKLPSLHTEALMIMLQWAGLREWGG